MKASLSSFSLFIAISAGFLYAAEPVTIHEAAKTGKLAAVQRFFDQDPSSVNHRDNDGNIPLHWAVQHSQVLVLRYYARRSSSERDIDKINRHNALPQEIFQHHVEVVRLLLDRGALVNSQNNVGRTPLHEAAADASLFFVRLLINHGASPNLKTHDGKTPVDLAHPDSIFDKEGKVANVLHHYAACLAFSCVLHPRLGAQSPANIFPQNVVQEIVEHLRPSDFAATNKSAR